MGRGFGPRMDKGFGLAPVDRPVKPLRAGSYRTQDRGGTGRGGTVYPSVLEAYNRDSDYRRWRAGLDYWQGSGKGWSDVERHYLVRSFLDFGAPPGPHLTVVSFFPSNSSPEGAWMVTCRRRGAIILPQLLHQQDITLDTAHAREDQHRLILDVSNTLSAQQLEAWQLFIGDQFEDSATGTAFPQGLIEEPIDTIAYTLVDVDAGNGRLLFDLSRPFMRRRPDPLKPRAFWQRIVYNRRLPLSWRNNGSRYLCSSHRLYCNCPDYSGGIVADLVGEKTASQKRFPRPGAGRSIEGYWESQQVGYSTRWRDLSPRVDRRRECKHIHAVRWSLGYPFYEPSDYEVGTSDRLFQGHTEDPLTSTEVLRYHNLRGITLDRLASALADSNGVAVDAGDTVADGEDTPAQPGRAPILWTSEREPAAVRAVAGDWWLLRGTEQLRMFDPAVQRFVETKLVGSARKPVIELISPGSLVAQEVP